ncbi:MAG: hypothetical protein HY559_01850 [Gammaproteobacteria bacterium]|nr:hypothetical protein [Gammaproteobacteria bacterium]
MKVHEQAVAKCYSTWGKTYYDEYYGEKAPYPPVHRELLRQLLRDFKAKTLIRCGVWTSFFSKRYY